MTFCDALLSSGGRSRRSKRRRAGPAVDYAELDRKMREEEARQAAAAAQQQQ